MKIYHDLGFIVVDSVEEAKDNRELAKTCNYDILVSDVYDGRLERRTAALVGIGRDVSYKSLENVISFTGFIFCGFDIIGNPDFCYGNGYNCIYAVLDKK